MIEGFTQKDAATLSAMILLHKQKVTDYSNAVPNVGMARRHNEFAETLLKLQTLAHGERPGCAGCVREGRVSAECGACVRNAALSDNFRRSKR